MVCRSLRHIHSYMAHVYCLCNRLCIYASYKKTMPKFRNEEEEEERSFWDKQDSIRYIDWSAVTAREFVQLRPSFRTISLTKNI